MFLRRCAAVILAACTIVAASVEALAATPSVGLRDNRPIDIILAAGETDFDLDKFESEMLSALSAAGVDTDRVKIESVESTNSAAETSFPWQVYASPPSFVGHASKTFTGNGDTLTFRGHRKTPFQVGYKYDVPSKGLTKFAVEFTVIPQRMDSHTISRGGFQFAGYDVQISARNNAITLVAPGVNVGLGVASSSGTTIRCEVTKSEARFFVNGSLAYVHTSPAKEVGTMYAYAIFTRHNCSSISVFSVSNVKVETQVAKDLIEVVRAPSWRPNSHRFVVDINDELREDFQEGDKLGELVQRMLKDGAYYVGLGTSKNLSQMQSYIGRNTGSGYVYDNTKSDALTKSALFIEPIVNQLAPLSGRQYLIQSDEYAVSNAASLPSGTTTAYPNGRWETKYTDTYSEGATSLKFINIEESPFWTNRYQKEFSFSTAQVGYYTNFFEDTSISPAEIVVHQKPIPAVSNLQVIRNSGNVTLKGTTKSYDPDFYDPSNPSTGRADKGIKTQTVKWRLAGLTSAAWSTTGVSISGTSFTISGLQANKEYEIYYNVTDYQGSEGNAVIKYINTYAAAADIKPIADFSLAATKISIYNWNNLVTDGRSNNFQTVLQDLSYDPLGKELVSYKWTWYAEDSDVALATYPESGTSTINTADPNTFANFLKFPATQGRGTYYLGLVVSRSGSSEFDTSELYKRVIEITREPYALWFSELYNQPSLIGLQSAASPAPEKTMQGYNRTSVAFQNNKRVITFNTLKGNPFTQVTFSYVVNDPAAETHANMRLKEYPLSLNTEFLWPVTQTQLNKGETMFSVWGTPTNDWAFVPAGTDPATRLPKYIQGVKADYVSDVRPWGYDFSSYLLVSTTEEESFRLTAKIPDSWTQAKQIYSPQLKRKVYDWISDSYITYSGVYNLTGSRFILNVPSTLSSIQIQGSADTSTYISGTTTPHRVAGVYFKPNYITDTTVTSTKQAFSQTGTTGMLTVNLPEKGKTYNQYFYVMPETSKITGETYTSVDVGSSVASFVNTKFATQCYTVAIRRMNDNVGLSVNNQLLMENQKSYKYLDNRTSASFALNTADTNAIITGYRVNGSENWTWIQSNRATITIPITRATSTVDIMVQAEDREIQELYTLIVEVPDTFNALGATVKYHSLTTNSTYQGVFDEASSTYTITLPENVQAGKLEIGTLNDASIVERIDGVAYDTSLVSIDYPLPYHTNPSANFTIRSQENGRKSYIVKFVKQNDAPNVTLLNLSDLDGVYSPQGVYSSVTGAFTPYSMVTTPGLAFNGNGVPIEILVKNKEHVQGVRATVKFNNFDFEVHWDSYDGPTYKDGATELRGFAVISKEAIAGLNGPALISCELRDYDYANSSAVAINIVDLATIETDSAGPIASHTATSAGGPQLNFTGVQDAGTFVKSFYMEYGPEDSSGYSQAAEFDVNGTPAFTVPLSGVTGPQRFRVVLTDILENTTVMEFNYDFSDVTGVNTHMEFGRNSDGYYIGIRDQDDTLLGLEQFEFLE